jgi:hypothetical protein
MIEEAEVYMEQVFRLVMEAGGEIRLNKSFSEPFPFIVIRGVASDDLDFDFEGDEEWNDYIDRCKALIGVNTYCEWVESEETEKKIGMLAFSDESGDEIKTKWMHEYDWKDLLDIVTMKTT